MPAFLTHWRVLIETAQRSQDAGSDLGSLIIDATALRRRLTGFPTPPQTTPAGAVWDTGPLPEIDFRFPGSDISAMAYLGALAPDIPSYQRGYFAGKISGRDQHHETRQDNDQPIQWARLLHTNRSGDFLLSFLEQIANIPSPASRSQALAFAMGYLSHIATDIALHPCINTLASIYTSQAASGIFAPLTPHSYVELCLDEYIAATYFERALYSWGNRPWVYYIEPAASHLTTPTTLTAQTLDLFISAAEATYGLSEQQSETLRREYRAGIHRLRLYLAGRGSFRWLLLNAQLRKRDHDLIRMTIAAQQRQAGIVTFEEAITYAVRLSERLCRRAISYYASLRNTEATANERNQRRAALLKDLRNWDLNTGYTLEVLFDQQVTLRFLHNWLYFEELWNSEAEQAQHTFAT
ncbi:MAG TPA: zinc dependent phospholipase C family protein [Ktedonosporobacter sp.]|nr:zinc dependent phospholipase C family protein [Ktedonosporobacter sp.]